MTLFYIILLALGIYNLAKIRKNNNRVTHVEVTQKSQSKEQARLAKEQERLAKEQAKQAEQLAKHEAEIQKLYFKVEKAEDEIAHFTSVLDSLNDTRDAIVSELADIERKLEMTKTVLDPLTASKMDEFDGADGAMRYMDMFASYDPEQESKKAKDAERLNKRKDVLSNKLTTTENRIFSAEQKIKKAEHDKFLAESKLSA